MPIAVTVIVAIVGTVLGIAVWAKTRRAGPVFGIFLGAFAIVAIGNPQILTAGGQLVGQAFTWASENVFNF